MGSDENLKTKDARLEKLSEVVKLIEQERYIDTAALCTLHRIVTWLATSTISRLNLELIHNSG